MGPYGAGGSTGGGGSVIALGGVGSVNTYKFVPSPYKFTDPPRFFKANDPYYFEVDNIPLKQLHENCLWLKDQIEGVNVELSGVPISKITDLKAFVNNADRKVYVNPGKFTARVNDAYQLTQLATMANSDTLDIAASPMYKLPDIAVPDSTFRMLVGSLVNIAIYGNGLGTHLQHHDTRVSKIVPTSENVPTGPITLEFQNEIAEFEDMPKVKTAAWRSSTGHPANLSMSTDLQQLSVDFCRRWNGVFRTAVVSVPNVLTVNIPSFDAADYANNSAGTPSVRIDLLFVYAHPIDALDSHILDANASSPEKITSPRLGVVKGAGAILMPNNGANDIVGTPGIIGGDANWPVPNDGNIGAYYDTSQEVGPGQDMAVPSTMADQLAENVVNNPFGSAVSFPSPDDLLNLAPLISEGAINGSLATVGQTVLPLCYIFVREGESIIKQSDIIDIRPFLRTAELTYNERAGVAAANPPLSLANPAVGKTEHYESLELVRDYLKIYIEDLIPTLTQQIEVERTVYLPQKANVFNSTPNNLGSSEDPTDHTLDGIHQDHFGKVNSVQITITGTPTDNPSNDSNKIYMRGGTDALGDSLILEDRQIAQFEGNGDVQSAAMPHSFWAPPIFVPPVNPNFDSGNYKTTIYSNSIQTNFNYVCIMTAYTWLDTVTVHF